MIKLSNLVGLDIYNESGKKLGSIFDVIIDLQSGEVVRLTLEPIRVSSPDDAKHVFKDKTVLFRNVKAISNIVIISNTSVEREEVPEPEAPKVSPYAQFRQKYRR